MAIMTCRLFLVLSSRAASPDRSPCVRRRRLVEAARGADLERRPTSTRRVRSDGRRRSPMWTRTASSTSSSATCGTRRRIGRCTPIRKVGNLRRRVGRLQPVVRLLGRGHRRGRLSGPDRHRLPRRAMPLVREPQGEHRPSSGRSTSSEHSACNETPQYVDLFGNGKRVLIMGWQPKGQGKRGPDGLVRSGQGSDPAVGDAPDQRAERAEEADSRHPSIRPRAGRGRPHTATANLMFLDTGGWWEQPAKDEGKAWKFHAAAPRPTPAQTCTPSTWTTTARPTSSAARRTATASGGTSNAPARTHNPYLRAQGDPSGPRCRRRMPCTFVDMNGDGLKDHRTPVKRWWAHGPNGDADPNVPADTLLARSEEGEGRHRQLCRTTASTTTQASALSSSSAT